MRKREKEIRKIVVECGLELVGLEFDGRNHYKVTAAAPQGRCGKFFFSNTPSDYRGDLNKRSDVRRFARECGVGA